MESDYEDRTAMDSAPPSVTDQGFERAAEPVCEPFSPEEICSAITKVRTANLFGIDIDDLKALVRPMLTGITISTPLFRPGEFLYRGIIWDERPVVVSQLSYLPPSLSSKYQRANRPGKPLFYATSAWPIVLLELDPVWGTCIAISKWRTTANLVVNNVGYTDEAFRILGTERMLPHWCAQHPEDESGVQVRRFMAEEFTKRVPSGSEHLYKITAAIAEVFCEQNQFGGLLYPSVSSSAAGDNLAIKPSFVDTSMQLVAVEYVRIEDRGIRLGEGPVQGKMTIRVLAKATKVGLAGEIHWLDEGDK